MDNPDGFSIKYEGGLTSKPPEIETEIEVFRLGTSLFSFGTCVREPETKITVILIRVGLSSFRE